MEGRIRQETFQMMFGSILAIALGILMLFYPGGTMALMAAAFWVIKLIISVFILSYTISEATRYFSAGRKTNGIVYLAIGIIATILVWLLNVGFVYLIVSIFFVLAGISEIFGAFYLAYGRYFLIFLGLLNILIGAIMIRHPMLLPLLIAWYVLFWGVSRLFLALEIRKMASQ
jgi:uncharacterized membrane protein HdeD (DUF308 family)